MLTEKEYNEFRKITFEDIEKNNILSKEEIEKLLGYLEKAKTEEEINDFKKEKSVFIVTKERNINAIKLGFAIINKAYNENDRVYELNETALSNISAPMALCRSPKVADALELFTIPFTVKDAFDWGNNKNKEFDYNEIYLPELKKIANEVFYIFNFDEKERNRLYSVEDIEKDFVELKKEKETKINEIEY